MLLQYREGGFVHTIEQIEEIIRSAIYNVTGKSNVNSDVNLTGYHMAIFPADFLYIFNLIELHTGLPIYRVLEDHSYKVLTIKNLVSALYELQLSVDTTEI